MPLNERCDPHFQGGRQFRIFIVGIEQCLQPGLKFLLLYK
jgi:hypothetical protein